MGSEVMRYSGEPLQDFADYCYEQERHAEQLPKCDYCGESIMEDCYYEIGGEKVCEQCLIANHRKAVD